MKMQSINPATEEIFSEFESTDKKHVADAVNKSEKALGIWSVKWKKEKELPNK